MQRLLKFLFLTTPVELKIRYRLTGVLCIALFVNILAVPAWADMAPVPQTVITNSVKPKEVEPTTVRIMGPITTERTENLKKWEIQDAKDKAANDDHMFYVALGALIIAFFQGAFFVYQLILMRDTIKQTDKALNHARQELTESQRAWVKVEIQIADNSPENPQSTSPLLIDQSGVYLWLKVKLKNYGNAPALSVFPAMRLHAPANNAVVLTRIQREYCEEVKDPSRHAQDMGGVLFPGEEVESLMRVNLLRSDLDKSVAHHSQSFSALPVPVFVLYILGCIDYKSAIDGSHRQTGFIFQVSARQLKSASLSLHGLMPMVEESIPAQDLILAAWNDSGAFFAN